MDKRREFTFRKNSRISLQDVVNEERCARCQCFRLLVWTRYETLQPSVADPVGIDCAYEIYFLRCLLNILDALLVKGNTRASATEGLIDAGAFNRS